MQADSLAGARIVVVCALRGMRARPAALQLRAGAEPRPRESGGEVQPALLKRAHALDKT